MLFLNWYIETTTIYTEWNVLYIPVSDTKVLDENMHAYQLLLKLRILHIKLQYETIDTEICKFL